MPVDTKHKLYDARLRQWERCRDALGGEDAVHAKSVAYLPKLTDQHEDDYQAYLKRAGWYNATARTVSGLKGMLLRKPPAVDVPESVKPLLDDVTLAGDPFQTFLSEVCQEILALGRVGVLVDYPDAQSVPGVTLADARRLNLRPTMQLYCAESITNWRIQTMNNKPTLTRVVLAETYLEEKDDFTGDECPQFRVLKLDAESGYYVVEVWRKTNTMVQGVPTSGWAVWNTFSPFMNNKPLDFIPFQFISGFNLDPRPDRPPLLDLVDVNYSHYRTTADYEHAGHFVGLPTPVISGYKPENPNDKMYIGSQAAWALPDPAAKAYFLEFTGQGMDGLAKVLDRKEQQMAVLGARMLEQQGTRKAVESADTQSIKRKGEEAMLSDVSQTISLGMTNATIWFCEWAGAPGEAKVDLNRDFYPVNLTPQELDALTNAHQGGDISDEEYFEALQEGEVIDPELTFEEHQQQLLDSAPKLGMGDLGLGGIGGPGTGPGFAGGGTGGA